ncbi:MAG: hypothetical protein ACM32J_17145 [Rhizobacter sp.]
MLSPMPMRVRVSLQVLVPLPLWIRMQMQIPQLDSPKRPHLRRLRPGQDP